MKEVAASAETTHSPAAARDRGFPAGFGGMWGHALATTTALLVRLSVLFALKSPRAVDSLGRDNGSG